jgi:hypothetical protein
MRQKRIELVELRLHRIAVREPGSSFHLADDWIKRTVGVLRRAKIAQPRVRVIREALKHRGREPRFVQRLIEAPERGIAAVAARTAASRARRVAMRATGVSAVSAGHAPASVSAYMTIVVVKIFVMKGCIQANMEVVRTSSPLVASSTVPMLTAAATKKAGK